MRPVRLQLQGFTCYREKQEIDFSRLGTFAIAGPTGSGKSSLLDAITFALYGKIPRLGGQNLDEFISLGASRASVVLDFDIQGERFRVVRSMLRNGGKKSQIEQITEGSQKTLGDGVGEVNERVRALLGLDYEAFIQSVLLPQGDFAKFLKSNPKDRQKILRDLLRLGVYEKMRERATAEARDLSGAIDVARNLLDGPYAPATPANLKLIEEGLADVLEKKDAATAALELGRETLQTIRGQWVLIKERQERSDSLDALHRDRPKIDELEKTVSRAKDAMAVIPVFKAATSKQEALNEADRNAHDLEGKLSAAQDDAKVKAADLLSARQQALELPPKRERISLLASIIPILPEHRSWSSRLKEITSSLATSENQIAEHELKIAAAQASLEEIQGQREQLSQQQTALGYDATIYTLLKNSRRLAFDLGQAQENDRNLADHLAVSRKQHREADAAFAAKEVVLKGAEEKHSTAADAAQAALIAFNDLQNQHRADALRSTLHAGDTCPVCAQPVNEVPLIAVPSDLQRAERSFQSCEKEKNIAAARRDKANQAAAQARADVQGAQARVSELEKQKAKAALKIEEYSRSLASAIYPLACPPGLLIEQFVEQQFAAHEELASTFQKLAEERGKIALLHQRAESDQAEAKMGLSAAQETKVRLDSERADAELRIRGYATSIAAVQSADPENEKEKLQNEVAELERRFLRLTDLHRAAETAARDMEVKVAASRTRLAGTTSERDQALEAVRIALRDTGFTDEMAARAAMLTAAAIAEREGRVTRYEDEVKQVSARIKQLETELEGVTTSETDVEDAVRRVKEAQDVSTRFEGRIGELSGQIKRLRSDTEKAEQLRVEQGSRMARHGLVQQLTRDLRSDCFQNYLLQGSFRRLVSGASSRLRQLDDRYELVIVDGKFAVIDHDHGSQIRLADTLSGGETFLVSLALALELSEQVQQAAGAVRLDSLFIDEGFGSLDPETLDTVAEAIENLGRTNRMVGVITHVAELHRRLPRLEIRTTVSGSVVQYVDD